MKDGRVVGCFVGFVGAGADGFDLVGDFLVDGVSFGVLFLVFEKESWSPKWSLECREGFRHLLLFHPGVG